MSSLAAFQECGIPAGGVKMCGVVGWVGQPGERDEARMAAGLASITHRGPDSHGSIVLPVGRKCVGLGHTRLAIVDLSEAGAQPMQSVDGRWWVSFNGELYNHLSLRDDERAWRGHSDTETLVELLAQHGLEGTLSRIDGMFAFAALDTHTGTLHLARDRFGIKPLYVTTEGPVAFASEVRGLRALGIDVDGVNRDQLQSFLALRYVPSPGTLWRGVSRLAAGHVLSVDVQSGLRRLRAYDRPTRTRFAGEFEDAVREWRQVLSAAVGRQLMGDVPVGILLSGGVDSALIAAMAREHAQGPLPTFTVGFRGGGPESELDDAQETAALLGMVNHRIEVGPEELLAGFDRTVRSIEEPLGTTSSLAFWHLTERARQEVTVVLAGQGADEPLGGYARYRFELILNALRGRRLVQPLAALIAGRRRIPGRRVLEALAAPEFSDRLIGAGSLFSARERQALTGRPDAGPARAVLAEWLDRMRVADTPVERAMAVDTRAQLADDLLLYGDKVSMAFALEVRVPFLDVEVVSFLESLPRHFKLTLGTGKRVHKTMAERYLPAHVVHRPKKGFKVPFADWVRGPWRSAFEERLLDPRGALAQVVDVDAVRQVWTQHQQGRDATRELFALASLEVLLRRDS